MATMAKRGIVYSMLSVLLLSAVVCVSSPSDAATGSITVNPGETKYLSFGTCAMGDYLLWDLEFVSLRVGFAYWLQAPNGTHSSLHYRTWGTYASAPGEWMLGFSMNESVASSTTVNYTVLTFTPVIGISSPLYDTFTDQAQVEIYGIVDEFADRVEVTIDRVDYIVADRVLGNWSAEISLPTEGEYDIYVYAILEWGLYAPRYFTQTNVIFDATPPEITILSPDDGGLVRTNDVTLTWQCSDNLYYRAIEIRIDGSSWERVSGNTKDLHLATGEHTISVRVTDSVLNQVTDTVTFTVDARAMSFNGPYYGLPLIGIAAGIAIAAVAIIVLLERRRRGPSATTVPEEPSPEPSAEDVSAPK